MNFLFYTAKKFSLNIKGFSSSIKNLGMLLELPFGELVAEQAYARDRIEGEFAKMVWPAAPTKAAAAKWSAIRGKATNTGKPQGVLRFDAPRMAETLGED